jgi:hypothetical protein
MIERETPEWRPLDPLRSIRDLAKLALNRFADHVDTRYANKINAPEDES